MEYRHIPNMITSIIYLLYQRTSIETDPVKLTQIYTSASLLDSLGINYVQDYSPGASTLSTLWSSVQSDMDSNSQIYLDSLVPSDVVTDISLVYSNTR